jgi:hypothetical protein
MEPRILKYLPRVEGGQVFDTVKQWRQHLNIAVYRATRISESSFVVADKVDSLVVVSATITCSGVVQPGIEVNTFFF